LAGPTRGKRDRTGNYLTTCVLNNPPVTRPTPSLYQPLRLLTVVRPL